jgi:hypothetical protein
MSELREAAKEVAALVSPHIVGAKKVPARVITLRRLSSSVPTLLDDLAAAQGEIERLREALREFLNAGGVQWMSGMTTSSAWSLPKLAAASVKAHSALTLKSEKEGAE